MKKQRTIMSFGAKDNLIKTLMKLIGHFTQDTYPELG